MLNEQLIRLFSLMNIQPPSKTIKRIKFGKNKNVPKFGNLPDNVWEKILDNLSPFELVKMRRVNQKIKNLVEKRRKRLLYADFLRTDVNTILDAASTEDGDFYRHPKTARIIGHEESRSILIIVDNQWSVNDTIRILSAIRYYGENSHTITLDASLAELCVAAQSTNDIPFWFAFQSALGTSDPISSYSKIPSWVPDECRNRSVQSYEQDILAAYSQWSPRTQLIPLGPIFPKATEITIRSSIPQLRRLRRFGIYRSPFTRNLIDPTLLHNLRLVIATSSSPVKRGHQTAQSLKLTPFLKWANSSKLGHRFCVQFV